MPTIEEVIKALHETPLESYGYLMHHLPRFDGRPPRPVNAPEVSHFIYALHSLNTMTNEVEKKAAAIALRAEAIKSAWVPQRVPILLALAELYPVNDVSLFQLDNDTDTVFFCTGEVFGKKFLIDYITRFGYVNPFTKQPFLRQEIFRIAEATGFTKEKLEQLHEKACKASEKSRKTYEETLAHTNATSELLSLINDPRFHTLCGPGAKGCIEGLIDFRALLRWGNSQYKHIDTEEEKLKFMLDNSAQLIKWKCDVLLQGYLTDCNGWQFIRENFSNIYADATHHSFSGDKKFIFDHADEIRTLIHEKVITSSQFLKSMQTNELPLSLLIRVVLLTGDTKNAQRYVAIYGTSGMDEKTFFDGLSRNDVRQALMDYYPILAPYCTLKSDSPTVTSGLFSEKTSRKALVNGVLENIRAKYEILDLLLQLQEKYHAVENPEHENELNCLIVKVKNATQFMDDPKKFLLEEIQFAILAGKGNSRLYAALDELVSTMKKGEGISRERLEKIVAHITVNKSAQTQQMHL